MNRVEVEAAIAERTGIDKGTVSTVIDDLTRIVGERLRQGDTVRLIGFGTFAVRDRGARRGKNPKTGEEIFIPASRKPVFRAGKVLAAAVSG